MVSLGAAAAVALNLASTVQAATVSVLAVPPFPLERYADRGAVGLLVPGSGAHVSRESALASLRRGRLRASKLGGLPPGPDLIELGGRPAEITVYVALPPPGRHPNDRRYPIAIVGGGYHGLLTAPTRVPGLVSAANVAPTVLALQRGAKPAIRSRSDAHAVEHLRSLEARFDELHESRLWARVVLVTAMLGFAAIGLVRRSTTLATAALIAAPLALVGTLALSALDWSGAAATCAVLGSLLVVGGPIIGRVLGSGRRLGLALAAVLAVELVVLVAWPDVPALAAIGPHPDGGGRFYGVTNSVETLLLVLALVAGSLLGGAWLVAVGLLALATVGWSRAGADGGGLLVFATGFLVLWAQRRAETLSWRGIALIGTAVVTIGLVLVGLDALTGGSSHVTGAVGSGPGGLWDDWTRRLHLSYNTVTSAWLTIVLWLVSVGGLVAIARSRPRAATVDALLAAIAVSLVFNDSPNDVARLGVAAAAVLWAWERVRRTSVRTLQ